MHADFGGHLDYFGGYGPSPSPSPERPIVSPSKDDEDDAGSLVDDEMMNSQ